MTSNNDKIITNETVIYILLISALLTIIYITYFHHHNDHNDHNENREHYDARLSGLTITECGTECTRALNCSGFGYNHVGGKCYLSESTILGTPTQGLYSDEYSKLDKRCNKINKITDDKRLDGITLTQNSIYACSDGENNITSRYQYANLGSTSLDDKKTTIFDSIDSDYSVPTEVAYQTHDIVWPTKKEDLLPYDFNPDIPKENTTKKYGFVESNNEYLGQYLLPHQCVVNVPLYDCLNYCKDKPKCVGTEWIKNMFKDENGETRLYENICCPKSVIAKTINRRPQFNRGKFYIKKELNQLNKNNNIVISK